MRNKFHADESCLGLKSTRSSHLVGLLFAMSVVMSVPVMSYRERKERDDSSIKKNERKKKQQHTAVVVVVRMMVVMVPSVR